MEALAASQPLPVAEQTDAMALELQLQDIESIRGSRQGNYVEGSMTDMDLALKVYQEELEHNAKILSDRQMALSFARAVLTDGRAVHDANRAEACAARDRAMALQMAGRAVPAELRGPPEDPMDVDEEGGERLHDEYLQKLTALYVVRDSGELVNDDESSRVDSVMASSSSSVTSAEQTRQAANDRLCGVCHEMNLFFDVARAPCGHEYCRTCLQNLFQASMTDEALFPARCCRQPIPLETVRVFLTADLSQAYLKKKIEFETTNRTYCSSRACAAFVLPQHIGNDIATCRECGTATCTMCKTAAHGGDCPNDEPLQTLLAVAADRGWQRCYSCARVVELEIGCNHITCRCGAHFCYLCGLRWKTCGCDQWDEERLVARAGQIAARGQPEAQRRPPAGAAAAGQAQAVARRQPAAQRHPAAAQAPAARQPQVAAPRQPAAQPAPPAAVPPVGQAQAVQGGFDAVANIFADVVRNLRDNHECYHEQWMRIDGPYQCEECLDYLDVFIFECQQCALMACDRCRRNRL